MYSIPAKEFLERFTNAYGETWQELFFDLTSEAPCARHFAELIDDLEEYGQQETAYVDKDGIVMEGNRIAMCLAILGKDINYVVANPAEAEPNQFFTVDFEVAFGSQKEEREFFNHIDDYFSFRAGDDWVTPVDAVGEDGYVMVVLHCPSGQYTADRLPPIITDRLLRLAGVSMEALRVSEAEWLDEDAVE